MEQVNEIAQDKNAYHDSIVLDLLLLKNHEIPYVYQPKQSNHNDKMNPKIINEDDYSKKPTSKCNSERPNISHYSSNDNNVLSQRDVANLPNNHNIYIDEISKDKLKRLYCDDLNDHVVREKFLNAIQEKFWFLHSGKIDDEHLNNFIQQNEQYNDSFIKKSLKFIAFEVYSSKSLVSSKIVLDILLEENKGKTANFKKAVVEKILRLFLKIENFVEDFIPKKLLVSPSNYEKLSLYQILSNLKESRNNFQETPNRCVSIMNGIIFGTFLDTLALISLVYTDQMNWNYRKLSLNSLPLFYQFNWTTSLSLYFVYFYLFIQSSLIILYISIKKKYEYVIEKIGLVFISLLSSGLFIVSIIGLFSYMNCEPSHNIDSYYVFKHEELMCFSIPHIIIYYTAVGIFSIYFLLVLFFFPFIFKASSNFDSNYNVDLVGQVFYCMIFVFIPDDYFNLKLVLSAIICAFLCVFWVHNSIKSRKRKINYKTTEYFIATLVYLLSLGIYNFEVSNIGFLILAVVIIVDFLVNFLLLCQTLLQKVRQRTNSNSNLARECGSFKERGDKTVLEEKKGDN